MESPRDRAKRACDLIRQYNLGRITAALHVEREIRDAVEDERERLITQLQEHRFDVTTPPVRSRLFLAFSLLATPKMFLKTCVEAVKRTLVAHIKRNS
jgi:hypothetical protein